MQLCSRPEPFGTSSVLSPSLPTSCFIDTILLPLPIWLALALLPILYIYSLSYRKLHFDPSTFHLRAPSSKGRLGLVITSVVYYVLIVCNILMQVLEIVRLELLSYGFGLLPFVVVGLLLGGALHFTRGFGSQLRFWEGINGIVWVGGITMCIVKVISLIEEGINTRQGSKYPTSDQVTDVAVMAGLYIIIAILEVGLGVWRRHRDQMAASKAGLEIRNETVNLNGRKDSSPFDING